jgi:hypothetical protein
MESAKHADSISFVNEVHVPKESDNPPLPEFLELFSGSDRHEGEAVVSVEASFQDDRVPMVMK